MKYLYRIVFIAVCNSLLAVETTDTLETNPGRLFAKKCTNKKLTIDQIRAELEQLPKNDDYRLAVMSELIKNLSDEHLQETIEKTSKLCGRIPTVFSIRPPFKSSPREPVGHEWLILQALNRISQTEK